MIRELDDSGSRALIAPRDCDEFENSPAAIGPWIICSPGEKPVIKS